jgi:hypothetical protein
VRNITQLSKLAAEARPRVGRWDVINSAIGSTARTIRLTAIILVSAVPPAALAALVGLLTRR